jgi:hypothetical protein
LEFTVNFREKSYSGKIYTSESGQNWAYSTGTTQVVISCKQYGERTEIFSEGLRVGEHDLVNAARSLGVEIVSKLASEQAATYERTKNEVRKDILPALPAEATTR